MGRRLREGESEVRSEGGKRNERYSVRRRAFERTQ